MDTIGQVDWPVGKAVDFLQLDAFAVKFSQNGASAFRAEVEG
jgi:hypothetical protein